MADGQLDMADDLASLAEEHSDAAKEIGDMIVVQLQVHVAITEPRTYSEAVGDPKFGHQ